MSATPQEAGGSRPSDIRQALSAMVALWERTEECRRIAERELVEVRKDLIDTEQELREVELAADDEIRRLTLENAKLQTLLYESGISPFCKHCRGKRL